MADYADLGSRDVFRLLHLFERLNKGEILTKEALSKEYAVSEKTVQRDLDDLRYYLSTIHYKMEQALRYDKKRKGYVLDEKVWQYQTNQQILAVAKILLASRAFNKEEMDALLTNLITSSTPEERGQIRETVRNEQFHYVPLHHEMPMLDLLWNISNHIHSQNIIAFDYCRQDGKVFGRTAIPVAVLFSEYYFYLIAYYHKSPKPYPAIFRMDRVQNIVATGEKGTTAYPDRFEEGELRKRIQFMYGGDKMTVKFKFWGVFSTGSAR